MKSKAISDFTEFESKDRKDFAGEFKITFNYNDGNNAVVSVHPGTGHTGLNFVSNECPAREKLNIESIKENIRGWIGNASYSTKEIYDLSERR